MATVHQVQSAKPYALIRWDLGEVLTFGPGHEVQDSELLQLGWTVHEFDFDHRHVVLLDVGAACELFTAPFAYQRQLTAAQRVAFIGFDAFVALAGRITQTAKLVHLFNIGHCGSTLLHQVINASGAAWSISEPKFTYDLAFHRAKIPVTESVELARAAAKFFALLPRLEERPVLVLKHFSQSMKVLDIWAKAAPDARTIFFYRDALGWINSRYGFMQRRNIVTDPPKDQWLTRWQIMSVATSPSVLEGVVDLGADHMPFEDMTTVAWALMMMNYRKAIADGLTMPAFNYQMLLVHRAETLAAIFAACGVSVRNITSALAAFDKDSHEGEVTAHNKPVKKLGSAAKARMDEILAHPRFAAAREEFLQ